MSAAPTQTEMVVARWTVKDLRDGTTESGKFWTEDHDPMLEEDISLEGAIALLYQVGYLKIGEEIKGDDWEVGKQLHLNMDVLATGDLVVTVDRAGPEYLPTFSYKARCSDWTQINEAMDNYNPDTDIITKPPVEV